MDIEIKRKFLVKDLGILKGLSKTSMVRYFLFVAKNVEMRIQKKGETCEFERVDSNDEGARKKIKFEISKKEFEVLKKLAVAKTERDTCVVSKDPEIVIRVYKGKFKGLVRAEVAFGSKEEARKFKKLEWMGREITGTDLARDARLVGLGEGEFKKKLGK